MASKERDDHCNTETDEETLAMKKKRSRRVSFAEREITNVFVFKRDEDYETPPEAKPSSDNPEIGHDDDVFRFLNEFGDDPKDLSPDDKSVDDGDDEEEDGVAARKSFLRPMGSPSSGSSSFCGSASSIDEDDFFGPVSAHFIRPGRLSDSAASDDNHDVTMDSTAFSMHFRSLVRSESGDLKTPTGVSIASEEKTPTQNTTEPGSSMAMTKAKKLFAQASPSVDRVSGGKGSNDMSLVGENPRSYDFYDLSPRLDAILAGGSMDMQDVSISDVSKSDSLVIGDTDGVHADNISVASDVMMGEAKSSPVTDVDDPPISTPAQLIRGSNMYTKDAARTSRPESEYPATTSSSSSDRLSNVVQLDVSMQHESGHQRDTMNENSPSDRTYPGQLNQSPLVDSISSLSAKRREIFMDSTPSSKQLPIVASPPKQPGSLLSEENIRHGDAVMSIVKSMVNLKSSEFSPYGYLLKDETEIPKLKPFCYPTSPSNNVLVENSRDLHQNHPIVSLQSNGIELKKGENDSMIDMDCDGAVAPVNTKSMETVHQGDDTTSLANEEASHPMSIDILSKDSPKKLSSPTGSPVQFPWSGRKQMQSLLMSENIAGENSILSEMESPLVTLDNEKNVRIADLSDKFVPSPQQRLHQKSSASKFHHNSSPSELKYGDQFQDTVAIGSGHHEESMQIVTGDSYSAAVPDALYERISSSSPFSKIERLEDQTQLGRVDDREINLPQSQKQPDIWRNFQTPLRDRDTLDISSGSKYTNLQTQTDPTQSRKQRFHELTKPSSYGSVSTLNKKNTNISSPQKGPTRAQLFRSPARNVSSASHSREDPYSGPEKGNHNPISDAPDSNNYSQGLHVSQNPFPEVENSPGRKRSREDVAIDDGLSRVLSRIQRKPEVYKSTNLESEHDHISNTEIEKTGQTTPFKHWTDIVQKFSGDTEKMLYPMTEKLNIRAIGLLEDTIAQLQKVKIYDTLSSEFRTQKQFDQFSTIKHKRVAETRLILCKMLYEKAKLQLMQVKRQKLLKKIQILSPGIQDSQTLKLHHTKLMCLMHPRDPQINDKCSGSCPVDVEGKDEVCCDKLTTMRKDFESLGRKIQNLTMSVHGYCKIKGETDSANTIALVNDHLKKRACCRLIRQDFQLWEVGDLKSKNGQKNIVLDYLGFIFQRITVSGSSLPSLKISNIYNDTKIVKNFPNMDACTAFAFVFKTETCNKYSGLRSLAQETQVMSSVLQNLLDVIDEVQFAQIEINNLIETCFLPHSGERLDLQLRFISFNSGTNVNMTLDVTCLKWGIYPSEALPYTLQVQPAGTRKSATQSLAAEISAGAKSLAVGYSRIVRLCKVVSQVMQSS